LVYEVKHDGRHKSTLVAGGHLTDSSSESVYSGVVSLRGLSFIIFLAELNLLTIWGSDVGNAYQEGKNKEKVYIVGGPTLIIYKSLYGLRASGICWHQRLAEVLCSLVFSPCKVESDIWIREKVGVYEYITVYVDDIMIAAKDPSKNTRALETEHMVKHKDVGPVEYHLGCNYFRDKDGTLCFGPCKYIDKLIEQFETVFGTKPKEYTSPLGMGDCPEIDTSDEFSNKVYQYIIGCLQWAITIGSLHPYSHYDHV
jgi:Reverse transcriptase (RNA-dependent DNA polymerase)